MVLFRDLLIDFSSMPDGHNTNAPTSPINRVDNAEPPDAIFPEANQILSKWFSDRWFLAQSPEDCLDTLLYVRREMANDLSNVWRNI